MSTAPAEYPLLFRTGVIADVPAVGRLSRASFDPHYREAWTDVQMAAVLAGPGGALLLLEENSGGLVAFALCRQILDESELLLCAIRPDRRRLGIGRRLMAEIAQYYRTHGARRIFLEVREGNHAARRLYESCGYRQQGRRPAYYHDMDGVAIDAITLSLHLHSGIMAK